MLIDDIEYFLPFSDFPWFRAAPVSAIMNVARPHGEHLYWPDLDIDLELESIRQPQHYPLIAQSEA